MKFIVEPLQESRQDKGPPWGYTTACALCSENPAFCGPSEY